MRPDRRVRGREPAADPSDSVDASRLLASPRRVAILEVLTEAEGPMSVAELARRVVAGERSATATSIDDRDVHRLAISLRHAHLPRLASYSVVDWDRDESVVGLSDDATPPRLPVDPTDVSTPAFARLFRTLSQPRRRLVLAALGARETPLSLDELARDVAAAETAREPDSVSAPTVDRIRISLVHSHLPALSAADVVTYDEASGLVDAVPHDGDVE
ncbi:DUF7344 domain-containing protein [Halovivax limisalsi]|uniref:DUF7344 domain-containing protein n=1 Tax=Halovivax limisalsi TaxID=1453760 RepID=UPI001FFD02E5|nr:hypothetical protein [Halovivax limisalsi]